MYLSATPIPRALNLALTDLKDFSIIASPPHGRKPVETIVSRESKSFIKEAIRRETLRGGQTFYVCNRIHKLEEEKYKLTQIFPEKNIDIVLDKKNIFVASKKKDITQEIIKLIDSKIK